MDMHASATSLASVDAGWEEDRRMMRRSITALTEEALALRDSPLLRTIGHLAAHIVAARARMIHWTLGEGGGDLEMLAIWDGFDQPAPLALRQSSDVVQGLQATEGAIQQTLNRWTVADLDQAVEWRFGDEPHTSTRQRIL
jgi:hypothetical protein